MAHLWFPDNETAQALLKVPIRLGLPIVLTQVLRPRIHQEYFEITIPGCSIAKNSPP